MRRVKTDTDYGARLGQGPDQLLTIMSKRDYRLMLAVVRAADNLRDCNYNDQHNDNPIGVLNDALDAFNKGARK
jgi:hypothetical protein